MRVRIEGRNSGVSGSEHFGSWIADFELKEGRRRLFSIRDPQSKIQNWHWLDTANRKGSGC